MAQSIINWTPGSGTNSLNQTIQYKLQTSSTWIVFDTVSVGVGTATITGLLDNRIYDFRVIDNCSVGGPTNSAVFSGIKIICPTVTVSPSHSTTQYSFANPGGDASRFVITLLNAGGTVVLQTQTVTGPGPSVTGMFTDLTPSQSYTLKVTVFAGATYDYQKTCGVTSFLTSAAPVCSAPTAVTATIS